MKKVKKTLNTGKLEIGILREFLNKYTIVDPRVIVGPRVGEDAAVIDMDERSDICWVVTADPITFTTDEIGYYGVVVNLNDIATRGAIPRWFLATLLFPEKGSMKVIEEVFRQIHDACRRFGISFIGGHTEITPGIERLILSGHMIGEVKKDKIVKTSGAKPGDLLLLVKGVCIEGTSIIARKKEGDLLAQGVAPSLIRKARNFIFNPGIEVLRAARLACDSVAVHSMHDPTEGGVVNGIVEMALAADVEIEVTLEKIHVYRESRILCDALGLDPLGVIASGALLLTISPGDWPVLEKAFGEASIPIHVIGRLREGAARVIVADQKGPRRLEPLPRDEILKIYRPYDDGEME